MRSRIREAIPGRERLAGLVAALALLPVGACENLPLALGDFNSIITTATPALWDEVQGDLVPALERTVFTVRDEKIFTVTPGSPGTETWFKLRRLKQQLVIGTAADPWMAAPLAKIDGPVTPPRIAHMEDVWARGQLVTVVVLEEGNEAQSLRELTPRLADIYVDWFRDRSVARMFITKPDSTLSGELAENHGFTLLVPAVYRYEVTDSVHIFRNDNPDPSELIRQFAVTWRPLEPEFDTEDLLEWRARIVGGYYNYPQVINAERVIEGPETLNGFQAYSYQAVWENPPGTYPAGGPFVVRAVDCPEQGRRYLVDAWLYAPGRDKYEYMVQLDEITSSFRCTGGSGVAEAPRSVGRANVILS